MNEENLPEHLRASKKQIDFLKDLMTKDNLITAKEGTNLDEAKKVLRKHKIEKLPIVDRNFNLKGLITIKDIKKS